MTWEIQKAFDFANDLTKQLITLSTAIIALTITFTKDIIGTVSDEAKLFLMISWGIYLLSIIFGVWTLMALTGSLEPVKKPKDPPSIRGRNVTLPCALQIISFFTATGLVIAYGVLSS